MNDIQFAAASMQLGDPPGPFLTINNRAKISPSRGKGDPPPRGSGDQTTLDSPSHESNGYGCLKFVLRLNGPKRNFLYRVM